MEFDIRAMMAGEVYTPTSRCSGFCAISRASRPNDRPNAGWRNGRKPPKSTGHVRLDQLRAGVEATIRRRWDVVSAVLSPQCCGGATSVPVRERSGLSIVSFSGWFVDCYSCSSPRIGTCCSTPSPSRWRATGTRNSTPPTGCGDLPSAGGELGMLTSIAACGS